MKLYNTLSRKVEELNPLNPPRVSVYTCGPTVYDYAHIGHWFTYIRWDLLIRTLKAQALDPTWVMNITDVGHLVSDNDEGEDKLEKGARREGKTAWDIAEFYTKDFLSEMVALNILQPTHLPKATDHIKEQIDLISRLEQGGYTYVIDDGVYYDSSRFPRYADFARLDIEEQQAGARVGYNTQKRNPTDFALWKFSPKDSTRDMEWDSPWGKGFPGWHIECSAMSMKYLGETLDIHTGGIDHIPVHHTNEIAQSEAVTGKPFARMWLHSNHVLIDDAKISKSLGNGLRLKDIAERGINLQAFRLHVLESHYRSQSKFSWASLEAAQNRLDDLLALAALRWQTVPSAHDHSTFTFADVADELIRILSNDLHSEAALTYLSEVTKQTLTVLVSNEDRTEFETMLSAIDGLLGLSLLEVQDIAAGQKKLISKRDEARNAGKWEESDKIREQLSGEGIGLRDTPYGSIWFPLRQS